MQWVILAIILAVLFYSGFNFLKEFMTYREAENEYAEVNSLLEVADDTDPELIEMETSEAAELMHPDESAEQTGADSADTDDGKADEKVFITYPRVNIDYDELMAINSDFVGVLYLPALQLKYPIAHSHDNAEYLKRTFEGTSNPAGCIFMDVTASPDYSDRNTFIFGHNMKNLSMFGSLKTFQTDETLCPKHPYFYIYTKNRVFKYAIFAYYTVPTQDDMYLDFRGDDGYDAYVKKAVERSLFTPEEGAVDFSKRPNLVTLSTCYGSGHINNFVVQGALQGYAEINAFSSVTSWQ